MVVGTEHGNAWFAAQGWTLTPVLSFYKSLWGAIVQKIVLVFIK